MILAKHSREMTMRDVAVVEFMAALLTCDITVEDAAKLTRVAIVEVEQILVELHVDNSPT